jgi:hypothetical protein
MDFKVNRHNMINFMELFVKYCQINLTWSEIDSAKGIMACYNYAHKRNQVHAHVTSHSGHQFRAIGCNHAILR